MSETLLMVLASSFGGALITGAVTLLVYALKKRDAQQERAEAKAEEKQDRDDAERKALRYLMLYIIQERAMHHIQERHISLEVRRSLHHWHEVYHKGLGGNGDADALMAEIDELPVSILDACRCTE